MRTLLLITCVLTAVAANAQYVAGQSVEYTYDGAGNRILREPWDPSGGPSGKRNVDSETVVNPEDGETYPATSFNLFPNPSSGQFAILLSGDFDEKESSLVVFSSVGEAVYRETVTSGNVKIEVDLSSYPSGIYFVQLSNEDFSYRKSIVKQ